jgi:hypothetical protein
MSQSRRRPKSHLAQRDAPVRPGSTLHRLFELIAAEVSKNLRKGRDPKFIAEFPISITQQQQE